MFVILYVIFLERRLGWKERQHLSSIITVQKTMHVLSLSSQNQSVANVKHSPLSYKIFHKAVDESYLGVISSTPAWTEVPNSHNILLKKGCLVDTRSTV